jgi:hypothetical protein
MGKDNANLTPEKQLLKLIEEPQSAAALGHAARPKDAKAHRLIKGDVNLRVFWGKVLSLGTAPWDIKRVNSFLVFWVIVAGGFVVVHSLILSRRLAHVPDFSMSAVPVNSSKSRVIEMSVEVMKAQIDKISARDIFRLGRGPVAEDKGSSQKDEAADKAVEEAILNRYRLVGISWSDNPDVMLEDKTAQKTFFLKRNQILDGVLLTEIYRDRVVLKFKGSEVELR